jgi:hypothetical protein
MVVALRDLEQRVARSRILVGRLRPQPQFFGAAAKARDRLRQIVEDTVLEWRHVHHRVAHTADHRLGKA